MVIRRIKYNIIIVSEIIVGDWPTRLVLLLTWEYSPQNLLYYQQ